MESTSISIDDEITENHFDDIDNRRNSIHHINLSYRNQYRCVYCVNFIKLLPVLLIFSLITWSEYAFVRYVCFGSVHNNFERVIFLILHHIFLIMLVWSYSKTVFTKIPKVPKEFVLPSNKLSVYLNSNSDAEKRQILEEFSKSLPNINRTRDGCVRYCAFCNVIKPDRAHHCRMCGYCILKMDHHCPWVNTCICYFNYKYFILFLAYSLIYCLFIMAASLTYFLQQWNLMTRFQASGNIQLIFLFLIALVLLISILSLFTYHCYLIIKNRTTLEAFRAPIFENGVNKNGFNLGVYENFKQVFGNDPKYWFLPVCTNYHSGCFFPLAPEFTQAKYLLINLLDNSNSE